MKRQLLHTPEGVRDIYETAEAEMGKLTGGLNIPGL